MTRTLPVIHGRPASYLPDREGDAGRTLSGLLLDLDTSLIASVVMEADIKIKKGGASAKAMDVHSIYVNLLDAVVGLVRLTEEP